MSSHRNEILDSLVDADNVDAMLKARTTATHELPSIPTEEEIKELIRKTNYLMVKAGAKIWFTAEGDEKLTALGNTLNVSIENQPQIAELTVITVLVYSGIRYIQVVIEHIAEQEGFKHVHLQPYVTNSPPVPDPYMYKPKQQEKPWINQGRNKKGGRRKY